MKKELEIVEKYHDYYLDKGISIDVINKYLPYVENLTKKNIPIIFEMNHLSKLLGIQFSELKKMIFGTCSFYRSFKIPKRSGGKRDIYSPYPSLKSCQEWIYMNILLKSKVHKNCHGFTPQKSIITNAKPHLQSKCLLKMDLKNFFPSIPINWVIKYFSELGYSKDISFYLSKLCCYEDKLAQGAVTSPFLSNILLYALDKKLLHFSRENNLNYTRYADDLTFSGKSISYKVIDYITKLVKEYGLIINEDKTRLHLNKGQRIVTGISVSGEKLAVPRSFKRKLKLELHYINKFGYLSHVSKLKINTPNYLDVLQGKLNFWLSVEGKSEYLIDNLNYIKSIKKL